MLTKVILEGKFAEVAGQKEWMLECSSPSEALALIGVNKPEIKQWIRENINNYKVCQVDCESAKGVSESLTTETFMTERQCKTIRFLPIFTGAGGNNGALQAIAGVAMIVIGAVVGVVAGWTGIGGAVGAGMISSGIGMILGAICTMLMRPSANDDDEETGSSYYFNGAVNTTKQGMPVPLVFGRCRVGSAVISSSIDVSEG